jgi:DNA-binding CsgD family transcriptional regulator
MLTRREIQVAELVASGRSRQEMAEALSVTVSAIDKVVHALKGKLGAGTHALLVLRCAEHLAARAEATAPRTEGPLVTQAPPPPAAGQPACAPVFDPALSVDALFARLGGLLGEFGVTHLAYSHIRAAAPGRIEHLASRWTLPEGVSFDTGLAPADNPTFAYAMAAWAPLPLDLEAIRSDAAYRLVPERIRRQHEHYIAEGLVRGITFPLPGLGAADRLVLSGILRHASAARFREVVDRHGDRMRLIAHDFRNAHVAKARPRFRLTEREAALLDRLADGSSLAEASAAEGISRRAAERCLAAAREALGLGTTVALVAAHLRNRSDPLLPF